jgi:formate hydrogenlyase transcriptional activator
VGTSLIFQDAVRQARIVAPTDSTVVLNGETGTGKEVFAGLIHELSPRAGGPFIRVNCASIPEGLFES